MAWPSTSPRTSTFVVAAAADPTALRAHARSRGCHAAGTLRHFYTAHPRMSEEIDQRGIDLLSPVWHTLHLTPEGRHDWYAELGSGRRARDAPNPELVAHGHD